MSQSQCQPKLSWKESVPYILVNVDPTPKQRDGNITQVPAPPYFSPLNLFWGGGRRATPFGRPPFKTRRLDPTVPTCPWKKPASRDPKNYVNKPLNKVIISNRWIPLQSCTLFSQHKLLGHSLMIFYGHHRMPSVWNPSYILVDPHCTWHVSWLALSLKVLIIAKYCCCPKGLPC